MTGPQMIRGTTAIGEHLGVRPTIVEHLHRQRQLPTFRLPHDPAVHATVAGLDDWRRLESSAGLLK